MKTINGKDVNDMRKNKTQKTNKTGSTACRKTKHKHDHFETEILLIEISIYV